MPTALSFFYIKKKKQKKDIVLKLDRLTRANLKIPPCMTRSKTLVFAVHPAWTATHTRTLAILGGIGLQENGGGLP